jgi:hypothetical protein
MDKRAPLPLAPVLRSSEHRIMKKPLKIVLVASLAFAVVLIVAVVVVGSNLNKIVKQVIVSSGSEMLATPVGLGEVRLSLREGSGGLFGMTIANPAGFSEANAFELDEVSLDLEVATVTSDEIVIKRVVIDGARILLEEKGGATNLKTLSDRLDIQKSEKPAEKEAAPKLVINELRFTNAQVRIISEKLGRETSAMIPDIVLNDVGRKGAGLTAAEVGVEVMRPLMRKILESAGRKILEHEGAKGIRSLLEKVTGGAQPAPAP